MKYPQFYLGIDISNRDFAASIFTAPGAPILSLTQISNDISGFERFEFWLNSNKVKSDNSIICMEATGVYGEALSYWLTAKGYKVAVEPPLKVKRSFSDKSHKNDKADSKKISEYAFRYFDELNIWRPKPAIVEKINVLLMTREQLVEQKTAMQNTFTALQKKTVQASLANGIYKKNIEQFQVQIKKIEKEIKKTIEADPDLNRTFQHLILIPGVALLLAANFLVVTNGFENELAVNYRKAAAYIGICPYQHSSGTSVYKKPRIPNYGPPRMRKLLHLASRSVVTHSKRFSGYYKQKVAQGKARKLVLNNVSNKILKIMCAIVRTDSPYVDNYVSINPNSMKFNT